jgi:hypothetical protein
MPTPSCLIEGCTAKAYAPAGTGTLCKTHFLSFVTWRRRKGAAMFYKYGALAMDERNTVLAEWQKTVRTE